MDLSAEATELKLYAINVEKFIRPAWITLGKFHKAGTFNLAKAILYVERYCLTPAAKQYNQEYCAAGDRWYTLFPKSARLEAAESIVKNMVDIFFSWELLVMSVFANASLRVGNVRIIIEATYKYKLVSDGFVLDECQGFDNVQDCISEAIDKALLCSGKTQNENL